jgi:hypothetical protein
VKRTHSVRIRRSSQAIAYSPEAGMSNEIRKYSNR